MKKSFERKLIGYAAVASTATLAGARTSQAALISASFTGVPNAGGNLVDSSNTTFLAMGNDAVTNVNGTSHAGVHLYVLNKAENAQWVSVGNMGTGALANLPGGTVLGSSLATGLAWDSDSGTGSTDNDIAYIDTVAGAQYVPSGSANSTPVQFSLDTPGYFGFQFTPASTPFYGYALIDYNAAGTETVTYTYDNTGASVTVPSAVPEPASLSVLALGAVTMLRRSRKVRN